MYKNFIISYFFLAICLGAPYFNSDKSFKYLLKQCEIGYRYPGSDGQLEFKEYLLSLGHLIVEKELNSGLNGFEIKDKIIFGVADQRRNGVVLYN